MVCLNYILDAIVKGYVTPVGIKEFLDRFFDIICEEGFSKSVESMISSIKRFEDIIFRYEETRGHIIKEIMN